MSRPPVVGQAVLALEAPAPGPSPEALHAAAQTFADSLHEHLLLSLRAGRLEGAMGALRGFASLIDLVGMPLSAETFRTACRRPPAE